MVWGQQSYFLSSEPDVFGAVDINIVITVIVLEDLGEWTSVGSFE